MTNAVASEAKRPRLSDAGSLTTKEVVELLQSRPEGLSSDEVADRLTRFEPNLLGAH